MPNPDPQLARETKGRSFRNMEEIRETFFPNSCPSCGTPKAEAQTDFKALLTNGRLCRCGRRWNEPA